MEHKKHVRFTGRLVFVGFGSVGQGSLPLLLRHIDMPRERIVIVTDGIDTRSRMTAEEVSGIASAARCTSTPASSPGLADTPIRM